MREKEKRQIGREKERREPFARARLFIFRPISNYRGYERTRIRGGNRRKGVTGVNRAWSGFIFGLCMSCRSLLSLGFSSLFRTSLLTGSTTSSPLRHAVLPPSTCRFTWKPRRPPRIFYAKTCVKTRGPSSRVKRPGPPQRPRALRVVWSRLIRLPSCQSDSAKTSGRMIFILSFL